jgi:hypothetical protein
LIRKEKPYHSESSEYLELTDLWLGILSSTAQNSDVTQIAILRMLFVFKARTGSLATLIK